MVAKARSMMRKEADKRAEAEGGGGGWRVVDGEEARRKDKQVTQELLGKEVMGGAKGELCWQCNERGHTSRRCPLGVICFYCRKSGHQKHNCLVLKARMGASATIRFSAPSMTAQGRVKIINWEGLSSRWVARTEWREGGELESKGENLKLVREEEKRTSEKEVNLEERLCFDDDDSRREKGRVNNWVRGPPSTTVYIPATDDSVMQEARLSLFWGVVKPIGGDVSTTDIIGTLREMSESYKEWEWKPLLTSDEIVFQFPASGGLAVLCEMDRIKCKSGWGRS